MIQHLRYKRRFSSFQIIIAGFATVDLVGALILMLPIAARQRCVTPFQEALFTSTSALCVTGLVVQDTGSYWSVFGQSVILLLIQIGDFSQAAQHDAGSHCCPTDGWYRASDGLYSANHSGV